MGLHLNCAISLPEQLCHNISIVAVIAITAIIAIISALLYHCYCHGQTISTLLPLLLNFHNILVYLPVSLSAPYQRCSVPTPARLEISIPPTYSIHWRCRFFSLTSFTIYRREYPRSVDVLVQSTSNVQRIAFQTVYV